MKLYTVTNMRLFIVHMPYIEKKGAPETTRRNYSSRSNAATSAKT